MSRHRATALIVFVLTATIFIQSSGTGFSDSAAVAHHVMLTPGDMKWGPFPALGPGIQRHDSIRRSSQDRFTVRVSSQNAGWGKSSSSLASD